MNWMVKRKVFNENLKRQMDKKGYNVETLSADAGIDKMVLCGYLSGRFIPPKVTIKVLADALECTVEELKSIHITSI